MENDNLDVKPQRTKEVINQEYRELCAQAGDKQYRVEVLKAELDQLNHKLLALNQESAKLPQATVTDIRPKDPKDIA